MGNKNFILDNLDLSIVLIIYSILAIISLNFYHFNLGADGISYISIALKYVNGDWVNAINGVWSPLYSWLMTPIMLIGYNTAYATYITRIVSLIIGFFTIIGISHLSSIFELDRTIKRALLVTSIPMVLFFAIIYDTPDLLVVCLLTYYFSIIFKPDYSDKWTNGALCGFIGAMAFLSKSYIFPFFLVHFILFNLIYYFKGGKLKKANIKKSLFFGLMVFMLISGIWIGTISEKYDKLTIGTANEYNHEVIGPDYPDHPVYFMGLIKPPYPNATSTWDDPYLVKMKDWSPIESLHNFDYQLNIIAENLYRTLIMIEYYSLLSLIIIITSLYLILKSDTPEFVKKNLSYLLISIGIYTGGYCLIMVQERFLWPIIILVMTCGFYLAKKLYDNKSISIRIRNIFIIILMFSFIFNPAYELINYPHTDNGIYDLSKTLQNDYGVHGNIASNGNWGNTLQIAYYLNSQYYGLPKNINDSIELENELLANNINYYFVWGDPINVHLLNYNEITNGRISGLRIYVIN
ncbi:hypothetical protein [Methanobacterium formicicum]|uniref:Glycosyltransferase RgtA/B/C/D-like domain-containing protein n=1 Tax=Methanobacterium formicicum (strain DSM 3637 / PP1) TaxID=1204725 RepID=K2R0F9_METFP|nr:hypothetical protein [Methanobacterium formicicum]EKF86023.1 hypothetical protein A994_06036 [Methanobacterium formicicum DSM 3637]